MNHISILLVESNPGERALIQEYLSASPFLNFSLSEAESLKAALSLLAHNDFDVVLLDLELPDSAGLETVRNIIIELRETAIIVLSSPQSEELAEQAVRYGTDDYIQKNLLSSAMLTKSIRFAMERKKIIQEKYDVLSDLALALEEIDILESLLPICVGCKKIIGEEKRWLDLEEFVKQLKPRTRGLICPDCQEGLDKN